MKKLSRSLEQLKQLVNSSKNLNVRFVGVKDNRRCKYCDSIIGVGATCLTTNKKNEGRSWICLSCVDAIQKYKETKAQMNCVPFGDDGAYLALSDMIAEEEAELYERGIFK